MNSLTYTKCLSFVHGALEVKTAIGLSVHVSVASLLDGECGRLSGVTLFDNCAVILPKETTRLEMRRPEVGRHGTEAADTGGDDDVELWQRLCDRLDPTEHVDSVKDTTRLNT